MVKAELSPSAAAAAAAALDPWAELSPSAAASAVDPWAELSPSAVAGPKADPSEEATDILISR